MSERKPISNKLRFEVFKRDSFTCQYCGKKAPDVILEVDHINPVASGGDTTILNLITSCYECNHGKGKRELSDDTVVTKQQAQLEELQAKREQLEMMFCWQKELLDLELYATKEVVAIIDKLTYPWCKTEHGIEFIKTLLSKFTPIEIIEAYKIGISQYGQYEDGKLTEACIDKIADMVPRICYNRKRFESNPDEKQIYYIRGIVRNRFGRYVNWKELNWIKEAYKKGASLDKLQDWAAKAHNYSEWKDNLLCYIEAGSSDGKG